MNLQMEIRLEREDGLPAFAAFLRRRDKHDESPVILMNVHANMTAGGSGLSAEDRQRLIITTLMHEFGHVLESYFRLPVNEEAIEAACEEWRSSYYAADEHGANQ